MNNWRTLFALVALVLVLQGCVTTIGIKSNPSDQQTTMYESGAKAVVSAKTNIVAVRPVSQSFKSNKKPSFVVTIQNGTSNQINFSTENISARNNNKLIKVFTYDELVAEVEKQKAIQAFATALAGAGRAMSAANAGNQYQHGSYNSHSNGNIYSPYGNASYSGNEYGTYSGYSYNAAAAQQAQAVAQAQTDKDFARIAANSESALSELGRTILRKHTVFPGKWHGGYIKLAHIELGEGKNSLAVVVDVGGEMHPFNFTLYKVE